MSGALTRVSIVTPHHPSAASGGAEYQIQCLLESLVELGRYEISYVARSVSPGFEPAGYRVVRIGQSPRAPRFGYAMDAVPLYRALRMLRPQVIYQRVACGYSGICAWYARRNSARMIWHVAHDTDVTRETLDPGRNPVRPIIENAAIDYMIRTTDHIVTQTQWQGTELERHYGRRADGVVRNFHPEPREALDKSGPATVLWVANFKRWKRPELFLDLAAALSDIPAARFVMVGAEAGGSGERDWNNSVLERIRSSPNVEYLGSRPQSEINRLLARAHVFVNTSRSEGFPNTFIQAWMRAVPVVSLNVDPDQVLEREAVGFHVGTAETLAQAVRRLLLSPSLREEYGARARQYALRRHSLSNLRRLTQLIDTGRMEPEPG